LMFAGISIEARCTIAQSIDHRTAATLQLAS
jgi:hypothetical protein